MRVVTGRGRWVTVIGVVLLVAGIAWHYWSLAGIGAALVVLVALEVVAVLGSGSLVADRTVEPLVVPREESCTGTLRLTWRRGLLPVRLAATEVVGGTLLPVDLPDADASGDGSRVTSTYPIPTARRGLLRVGPLRVRREGLAGMAARTDLAGDEVLVRVLPAVVTVGAMLGGRRRASVGADERVAHGGTDLVGLHEYVPGDDLRRLHWATSARTGTLMIRDDADPSEPRLLVLLDDRTASYPEGSDDFEDAVEIANGLARKAIGDGRQVRVRSVTGRLDVEVDSSGGTGSPGAGPGDTARELSLALAEIETSDDPADPHVATRDLDVALAVTGAPAGSADFVATLSDAGDGVLLVVDPAPPGPYGAEGTVLVLRAAGSRDLAALWDVTVAR